MSLVDALMGGVVFGLASTASLQLYGSSLQFAQGGEERQQREAQMELALAEGYQRMAELTPDQPCTAAAKQLTDLLDLSSHQGLTSHSLVEGEVVRLVVRTPGLPERSRWYAPAAFGVCEVGA
jgi:hypothetical protein